MESDLYRRIHNKVRKWSNGFADKERPSMYEESYMMIESFLNRPKEKRDFISKKNGIRYRNYGTPAY